jgi:hypothetical protein
MTRYALLFALLVGGCSFGIDKLNAAGGDGLSDLGTEDLAQPPDLIGLDLTDVDLADPSDLGGVFSPSHVGAGYYDAQAAALSGISQIDTKALKINGAAAPAGTRLVKDTATNTAVLTVGAFTVSTDLTITGDKPLVIVASGVVTISAPIHANAIHHTPGPGGALPGAGLGKGTNGQSQGTDDSGGSGAGYGVAGAAGGDSNQDQGPTGGPAYGSAATIAGGSGGGTGGNSNSCPNAGAGLPKLGTGGAGGGALQISSSVSITVTAAGNINVGGGGGYAGCDQAAAGGGGSGGMIFLEAPTVDVQGALAANGGSGGGGGGVQNGTNGTNGNDGALSGTATPGGAGSTDTFGIPPAPVAGNGGNGAAALGGVTAGGKSFNGGGGGAGYGRIILRTRGTQPTTGGTISPPASVDMTL